MAGNPLLARPNPLLLAVEVEGSMEIGGDFVIEGVPEGWDGSRFIVPPTYTVGADYLNKNADGGTEVFSVASFPVEQPFMTRFSMNNISTITDFDVIVGVVDNLGRRTCFEPYRYPPETQARYHVIGNSINLLGGSAYAVGANSDVYEIYSDTTTLWLVRKGIPPRVFSCLIPEDAIWYKFFYNVYYAGTRIYTLRTRLDTAVVPVTTDNSTLTLRPPHHITKRIIDSTHYGVLGSAIGNWTGLLSNEHFVDVLQVPIQVRPLYIKPNDRECGAFVIQGDTIQFITNGGNGGLFEADGGTILPNLQWQAPFTTGGINFIYTIGDSVASCSLDVVPRLSVSGVDEDGNYPDLMQGEIVDFVANCPTAVFTCTNYPTLITREGHLVAPTDAKGETFGEKDCIIKVTGCGQTYTFNVHIQAMFPIPKFCGAEPNKWRPPLIPDYLPNTLTMTGGTSQIKDRNKEGILTWKVDYNLLNQKFIDGCSCPTTNHRSRCPITLETAERLDNFYKLVRYVKYFSVIDYQTGEPYKNVRLTSYTGDHSLYSTEQSRSLTMRQEGEGVFRGTLGDTPPSQRPASDDIPSITILQQSHSETSISLEVEDMMIPLNLNAKQMCCTGACGLNSHTQANGDVTVDTINVRGSGTHSIRIASDGGDNSSWVLYNFPAGGTHDGFTARFYINFEELPAGDTFILYSASVVGFFPTIFGLAYHAASGTFKTAVYSTVANNFTSWGSSGSPVLVTDQWYRIDISFNYDGAGTHNALCSAQIDGIAIADLPTANIGAGNSIYLPAIATFYNNTTQIYRIADFILTSDVADYPIGKGHIRRYLPQDATHNITTAGDFKRGGSGTNITNSTTDSDTLIDDQPMPMLGDTIVGNDFIRQTADTAGGALQYVEHTLENPDGYTATHAPRLIQYLAQRTKSDSGFVTAFGKLVDGTGIVTMFNFSDGDVSWGGYGSAVRLGLPASPSTNEVWKLTGTDGNFLTLKHRFGFFDNGNVGADLHALMLEAEFPEFD